MGLSPSSKQLNDEIMMYNDLGNRNRARPLQQTSSSTAIQQQQRRYSGRIRNQVGHHAGQARYGGDLFNDNKKQARASNAVYDYFSSSQSGPIRAPGGGSRQLAAKNMASLRNTQLASALARGSSQQDIPKHPTEVRASSQLTAAQGNYTN